MVDAQKIEDFTDEEIDEIVDGSGFCVKGGSGRADQRPGTAEPKHVFQVNGAQGHFPMNQDQTAGLLEGNHGRSGEKIVGPTGGNGSKRIAAAWANNHTVV